MEGPKTAGLRYAATKMGGTRAFGRYELLERVSVGGMAEVFRANDPVRGMVVAVKRILPEVVEDAEFLHIFEDEARIASKLEHPYIARMLDYGSVDDSYFIAFEFVDGKDLRAITRRALQAKEAIPLPVALTVLTRVAEALAYAHARKDETGAPVAIVHRDVSPQNVIVSYDGDVKLIDFGIAKAAGKLARTQVGTLKGKFGYMAPEQAAGRPDIDQRVDVFALGICAWELLTMERLFDGPNEIMVLDKLRRAAIAPPSAVNGQVPLALDAVIMKALAKDPAERYRSSREFYRDLNSTSSSLKALATREQIAQYMRRAFPEAQGTATGSAARHPQETQAMSGDASEKRGSDLDIFEGLGKKAGKPSAAAPPAPPGSLPASMPPSMGGAMGSVPGSLPVPPPPGRPPSMTPPPGGGGLPEFTAPKKTLLGIPQPGGSVTPPPPAASASGALPAPMAPPARGTTPPPPPGRGSLPPVAPPPARSAASSSAAISALPPSPTSTGQAAAQPAPSRGARMDWDDDDDEATHVFDKGGLEEEEANAAPRPAAGAPMPTATLPTSNPFGASTLPSVGAPPGSSAGAPGTSHSNIRPVPAGATLAGLGGGAFAKPAGMAAGPMPTPGPGAVEPMAAAAVPAAPTSQPADAAIASRLDQTAVVRPSSGGSKTGLFVGLGAGAAAVAAGVVFLLMPKTGRVVVNASDTKGKMLNDVVVSVDGRKQCETVPCIVDNLNAGDHIVKVTAAGFEMPAPKTVTVEARKDIPVDFTATPAGATTVTALKVSGSQAGVKLFLDDKEVGNLPQEVKDIAPGAHKVRLAGGDRYAPMEKTVTVTKDELLDLGPQTLKVVKGKITVNLGTPGAKVYLVSGTDRRELPTLPISVDIDTSKSWSLEASKTGLPDYKQPVTFDDGQAEKTFTVTVEPKAAATPEPKAPEPPTAATPEPKAATPPATPAPAHVSHSTPTPAPPAAPKPATPAATPAPKPPAAAAGEAFLNINSIPPSSVVLDGKPLGNTPKVKVPVSAGAHTVLFVNADEGLKKSVTVTVGAGETKAAIAKLRE